MSDNILTKIRTINPVQRRNPTAVHTMIDIAENVIRNPQQAAPILYGTQVRLPSQNNDTTLTDLDINLSDMGGSRFSVFPNTDPQTLADLLNYIDANWPSGGGGGGVTYYDYYATNTTNLGLAGGEVTDGSRTTWTLDHVPAANSLFVYRNGKYLTPILEYTLSSATITILAGDSPAALSVDEVISGKYSV